MRNLINDVTVYWMSKFGGFAFDRRTIEGKEVIDTSKRLDLDHLKLTGYQFEIHYALTPLSMGDIDKLLHIKECRKN